MLRSRSVLAEAAAQPLAARHGDRHRRRRSAITSGSSTGAAPRSTRARRRAADADPPIGRVLLLAAPPVLRFRSRRQSGRDMGRPGRGYDWPESNHGIADRPQGQPVDRRERRRRLAHAQVHAARASSSRNSASRRSARPAPTATKPAFAGNSHDTANFGRVAKIFIDPSANEAYVADGYLNKRVAVIDADSGKFKRYWGAYGNKPDDKDLGRYNPDDPPAQQFRTPVHCAELANDGLLYVCDRPNDRIQVFKADGTFVKETFIAKRTLGDGSVWDIAFSKDPTAAIPVRRRRQERAHLHHRSRQPRAPHELRRRRPAARPVLRRPQHRHRLEGQHLHDRDVRRKAAAEVRLQRSCPRHRASSGHGVAHKTGRIDIECSLPNVRTR